MIAKQGLTVKLPVPVIILWSQKLNEIYYVKISLNILLIVDIISITLHGAFK